VIPSFWICHFDLVPEHCVVRKAWQSSVPDRRSQKQTVLGDGEDWFWLVVWPVCLSVLLKLWTAFELGAAMDVDW
jgi:hypothetical protein